jgi:membrane protein YdbS with pleckstrin-like domain
VSAIPSLVLGRPAFAIGPLAVLGLGGLLVQLYPPARYRRWRWRLGELALELRRGVVVRRSDAVPYFRIQQIDVEQGPLDRLLGLSTLQVTTAAASGSVQLPGLPADDAPRIRHELLTRATLAVGNVDEQRDAV